MALVSASTLRRWAGVDPADLTQDEDLAESLGGAVARVEAGANLRLDSPPVTLKHYTREKRYSTRPPPPCPVPSSRPTDIIRLPHSPTGDTPPVVNYLSGGTYTAQPEENFRFPTGDSRSIEVIVGTIPTMRHGARVDFQVGYDEGQAPTKYTNVLKMIVQADHNAGGGGDVLKSKSEESEIWYDAKTTQKRIDDAIALLKVNKL